MMSMVQDEMGCRGEGGYPDSRTHDDNERVDVRLDGNTRIVNVSPSIGSSAGLL